MSVFDTRYFRRNPKPFFTFARELWPSGQFRPTPSHYFIRVLAEQGLLLRNFTQNFDGLERIAGIPAKRLIEAHGTFSSAECTECNREYPADYVKHAIFSDPLKIPQCKSATCNKGIVRPKIVFFGDRLPEKYHKSVVKDFPNTDLVIVLGTSLQVRPFCDVLSKIKPDVPRLFINNEHIEYVDSDFESVSMAQCASAGSSSTGYASRASLRISRLASSRQQYVPSKNGLPAQTDPEDFEFAKTNACSVFLQNTCDDGVMKIASMIGSKFASRLRELIAEDARAHAHAHGGGEVSEHVPESTSKNNTTVSSKDKKKRAPNINDTANNSVSNRRVSFVDDIPEPNAAALSNTIAEGVARVVAATSTHGVAAPTLQKQFIPARISRLESPVISRITFQYIPILKWTNPRWLLFTTPSPVITSVRFRWRNVHQLHVHRVHGFDKCPRFAAALHSWAFQHNESIKEILPLTNEFVSVRNVHHASTGTTKAQEYDINFSDPRLHFLDDVEEVDDDDDTHCCFKAESYIDVFGE
jgi:NAD-dependent SIR2 family protein deacetylase